MTMERNTMVFKDELRKVRNVEQLLDYHLKLFNETPSWRTLTDELRGVEEKGEVEAESFLSIRDLANYCGYKDHHSFTDSKLNKKPQKRRDVIKMGIALGLGIEDINYLLKLCKHSELYVKSHEDVIWMYIVAQKLWQPGEYASLEVLFQELDDIYARSEEIYGTLVGEQLREEGGRQSSAVMQILQEKQFENVAKELTGEQLYTKFFKSLGRWYKESVGMFEWEPEDKKAKADKNQEVQEEQIYEPAYWLPYANKYQKSDKRKEKVEAYENLSDNLKAGILPTRNKVLGLLIQFQVSPKRVEQILRNAKMSKLYAKDYVESTLIYAYRLLTSTHFNEFSDVKLKPEMAQDGTKDNYFCVADAVFTVMEKLIKLANENEKYVELRKVLVPALTEFMKEAL